jgi:hypothetical protein
MATGSRRINVTLDGEYAAKLSRIARRAHVSDGTLARSLLATALDEADPDSKTIVEILDGIPGAFERAQHGSEQARKGNVIELEKL